MRCVGMLAYQVTTTHAAHHDHMIGDGSVAISRADHFGAPERGRQHAAQSRRRIVAVSAAP